MNKNYRLTVLAALTLAGCGEPRPVPQPDLGRAQVLVRRKLEQYRAAVVASPSAATWAQYGRALHAHGMYREAEQAYAGALDAGASDPFAMHHLAGLCAAENLQTDLAIEHLQAALRIREDYAPTHLQLAVIAERDGRTDLARDHYERSLRLQPSSHAHLGLGRLALAAGDAGTALKQLRQALTQAPQSRSVHEALARAHAQLGERDASRAAARQSAALSGDPQIQDPLLGPVAAEDVSYAGLEERAHRLLLAGHFNPALQNIELALQLRPDSARARLYHGYILARLGRTEPALAELRSLLESEPDNTEARMYLGGILEQLRRFDQAREQADAVLAKSPEHPGALRLRASIALAQEDRRRALTDLQTLLRLNPEDPWAKPRLEQLMTTKR